MKYLSEEWVQRVGEELRKAFTEEGGLDLRFAQVVEEIPGGEPEKYLLFELEKSIFKAYTMGDADDLPADVPFVVYGDYDVYKGIINSEIEGSNCLMDGSLALEGNMVKAVALMGTYNKLEMCQRALVSETEFVG